ncbi:MAG: hypothetical protein M1420_05110 [Actinobacteria bacterium]|nr:hypothetical protein [Actinomycetota bacterium]
MDTLEIIRELEHDDALRAALRAVILGDELLSLPDQMRLLTAEVQKLTEAQERTEEAQKHTEESVKGLAEAQRSLEETVKGLAEAQRSLEETVKGLAEAQRSLEESVKGLAEAQKRTEEAQRSLEETVKGLAESQRSLEETVKGLAVSVNKLAEDVGEVSEVSCAAVLGAVAQWKGWTALDRPGPVDVGTGEVDVRARFSTDGGEVAILAEAKSRLYGKDVVKWASRVGEPAWRGQFLYPGFEGQVLPYVYGTLIYADALTEAERLGIGVIGPEGERIAPRPL